MSIYAPATALDSRGQRTGAATLVLADVPCSIEPLTGRELEQARQLYAAATFRVRLFGDPTTTLTPTHYLMFGARRLNIGYVLDPLQNGYALELFCGEEV